jgi:hypothetical protein
LDGLVFQKFASSVLGAIGAAAAPPLGYFVTYLLQGQEASALGNDPLADLA